MKWLISMTLVLMTLGHNGNAAETDPCKPYVETSSGYVNCFSPEGDSTRLVIRRWISWHPSVCGFDYKIQKARVDYFDRTDKVDKTMELPDGEFSVSDEFYPTVTCAHCGLQFRNCYWGAAPGDGNG